jgi:hypothetical protein
MKIFCRYRKILFTTDFTLRFELILIFVNKFSVKILHGFI